MTTRCSQCHGPLFEVDRIVGASECCDCDIRELEADIRAAARAKHAGQQQALDARPADRARVEAAIRQLAATGRPFSANDARSIHGVKGGVVGASFTALKNQGVIRAVGDETSTDVGTHGHRIFRWVGTAA